MCKYVSLILHAAAYTWLSQTKTDFRESSLKLMRSVPGYILPSKIYFPQVVIGPACRASRRPPRAPPPGSRTLARRTQRALVPRMQLFGRAFTWTPAHADKLIHVVLGFSVLSMSSRLLTQKNRMDEEKAELQKRLDHDLEDSVRRRQRLLLRAPELAKSAGLSASASAQFGAALSALDAEPLPAVAAAGTEVVPRPPPLDPRAALPEGGEKKAVAIF